MKRILPAVMTIAVLFPNFAMADELTAPAPVPVPHINAEAAILFNASTDEVLYRKNVDETIPAGSISKLMTMLIASEMIKSGKLKLTDVVPISENAWRTGNRSISMFLEVGRTATVKELMEGMGIGDANDAAVAMAEYISGSTDKFVDLMNNRAKELGMTHTNFKTPDGLQMDLTEKGSANDFLLLAEYYWKHFPENIKHYHTKADFKYNTRPDKQVRLVNQNSFISAMSSAVGFTSGSIKHTYNTVAAINQNGMKMIAVVLGDDNSYDRNVDAIRLFQYGQKQYKTVTEHRKGDVYNDFTVYKTNRTDKSPVVFGDNVTYVVKNEVTTDDLTYEYEGKSYLVGGTKKGDVIGVQKIYLKDKLINETNVLATENLPEGAGMQVFFDNIAIFFNHTLIDMLSNVLHRHKK